MLLHCTRSAHIQRSLKYTTQLSFFTSRIHHTVHALCTPLHTIHNTGIIQPRHFSDVAVGEVYTQRIPLKVRNTEDIIESILKKQIFEISYLYCIDDDYYISFVRNVCFKIVLAYTCVVELVDQVVLQQ